MIFAALCHDMGHFGFGSTDIEEYGKVRGFKAARRKLKNDLDLADARKSHMEVFHISKAFGVMDTYFSEYGQLNTAKSIVKHIILATDHQSRPVYKKIISALNDEEMPTDDIPRQALLIIKVTTCYSS